MKRLMENERLSEEEEVRSRGQEMKSCGCGKEEEEGGGERAGLSR